MLRLLSASLAAENLESHLGHFSSNDHAAELCSGCASQVAPRAVAVRSVGEQEHRHSARFDVLAVV